jgi:glycosyltransferase involved in cell wall biosynthesis
MKVYIANESKQRLGGGFTFLRNFIKAMKDKVEFVENVEDCDIYFIAGATMVSKEAVYEAKRMGKRIVLRIDNAVKDSRNRGCGMSRMKAIAQKADKLVYQSKWARDYLSDYLNKNGAVIRNSCDTDIFNPQGSKIAKNGKKVYLYTRFNRDDTKNWHEAWYEFQKIHKTLGNAELWLVGQFSPELVEYKFDFFNEEVVNYLGVIEDEELMAQIYRTANYLIFPFYNDACSNTLIEARCCGTKIFMTSSGSTGGTPEILHKDKPLEDFSLEKMAEKYLKLFEEVSCG